MWVDLTGTSGINNYLHMIGAGHICEYLYMYRNLYKFSQQGWEHMNKRANGAYHRHSQKGGKGSGKTYSVEEPERKQSHMLPVFRHFTRFWMWKTGKGDDFFNPSSSN